MSVFPEPIPDLAPRRTNQMALYAAFNRHAARERLWTAEVRDRWAALLEQWDDPACDPREVAARAITLVKDIFDDSADAALLDANRGPEPKTAGLAAVRELPALAVPQHGDVRGEP